MSYILSALKKVEHKRRSEQLPDLLSTHVESAPAGAAVRGRGRAVLKTVVVTGLLLAAGVWFLSPVGGERTLAWLDEQWSSMQLSRLLPSVISSGDAHREAAAPNQSLNRPLSEPLNKPLYKTVEVREFSPAPAGVPETSAKFSEPLARVDPPPAAAPLNPPPRVEPRPAAAPAPLQPPRTAEPQPAAAPPRTAAPPAAALLTRAGPVDFDSLPPDTRRRIPAFSVTGHLYSNARPQANKVIINGAALREGQYVNEDLMVSEITGDGVIMDFRGLHFLIAKARIFQ